MLVLSRRRNDTIRIGDSITITIVQVDTVSGRVRLGIEAPREVAVVRGEVYDPEHDQLPPPPLIEQMRFTERKIAELQNHYRSLEARLKKGER